MRMIQKRALERWETKLINCEVPSQAIWPIGKTLTKTGGPKAPSAIHCPFGPIFYPINKANIIAECTENQFKTHDLCYYDRRQHVEAQAEALLATADEDTSVNFQPCDISKETQSSNSGKAYGFDGISNKCLQHLPRRTVAYLIHLFNYCLQLVHFPAPQKEAKS
jgi:hypothetical protein